MHAIGSSTGSWSSTAKSARRGSTSRRASARPTSARWPSDLFYDLNRRPVESPFDLARRYGWGPQVAALIIADYLIANQGSPRRKHRGDTRPEDSVRLAPLFDSGLSFCVLLLRGWARERL